MIKLNHNNKKINFKLTFSLIIVFSLFILNNNQVQSINIPPFIDYMLSGLELNNFSQLTSDNVIDCSVEALIDAINGANLNPDVDTIELSSNCVYITKADYSDPDNFKNGFPLISTEIKIQGNDATILPAIRAFEITKEGNLFLENLQINKADADLGGAILNHGNLKINNVSFYENAGDSGGVLLNQGKAIITNTTFQNNTGISGGAILNHGTLELSNTTFSKNVADPKGGAIYNTGQALIFNTTFFENEACCCLDKGPDGGAIYNTGSMTLINTTFANNDANRNGDTLFNANGKIILKNSIITSNSYGSNCYGENIIDQGGNLQWPDDDNSCVGTHGDPLLDSSLRYNGGFTQTLALTAGSAAIDAGFDSICAAEPVNNISQNGVVRPSGPHCDIGSFELNYLVVLSITREDLNPTNLETVTFAVSFSKPVTGVDKSDFSLMTTGLSGASISSIQGSGADYTVSINTGSNSGTIKLVLIDDDSIRDLEGGYLGTQGAGNGDFTTGGTYTVDKINPAVVSINRGNSNPISAPSVDFIVKFSEPLVGVDLDDFSLAASDLINPAIMNLTGSGDTYVVTLDTGIGDGSLRLDLLDNDSITDDASNPLGGEGAGNADFTIGQTYTILANATFGDVPTNFWAYTWIERLYDADLTNGCYPDPLRYCPDDDVTRAQMAKFILTAINGPKYDPVEATGIFEDVPYEEENLWYLDWVDELFREGLTDGCSLTSLSFCPEASVSRAEMAKFILRAIEGKEYSPDPVQPGEETGFEDVEPGYWAAPWIKELNERGLTDGCQTNLYCPLAPVTRAQMAKFIMTAFNIP